MTKGLKLRGRKVISLLLVSLLFFVMFPNITENFKAYATSEFSASKMPKYPSNGQKYWVIFREGYRSSRIEMSTCDVLDNVTPSIRWNRNLTLQGARVNGRVNQYYLTENNTWEQIGTYDIFSDWATEIIASNLDIFDASGNLVKKSTTYLNMSL